MDLELAGRRSVPTHRRGIASTDELRVFKDTISRGPWDN